MATVDICRGGPLLLPPTLLFEWIQLRQQFKIALSMQQMPRQMR